MPGQRRTARGGGWSGTALAFAGAYMFFGAAPPWLDVYMLLGSSGTPISAHEFASTSSERWHLLFGSSASLVAEFAGTVGRIPTVCGVCVLAAAALSVLIPVTYRIWIYRLAMIAAIVALLGCLLVIGAVAANDAQYANAVSISVGCYFTLVSSLAALGIAYWSSRPRELTASEHLRTARSPMSNTGSAALTDDGSLAGGPVPRSGHMWT